MAAKFLIRKTEYLMEDVKDLTVAKALNRLNLLPEAHLVIRSGEMLVEHELIRDGDEIKIIPVISGGSV
jgi:sulfur carrier protein ThiS